jgi:hypothetical protein
MSPGFFFFGGNYGPQKRKIAEKHDPGGTCQGDRRDRGDDEQEGWGHEK